MAHFQPESLAHFNPEQVAHFEPEYLFPQNGLTGRGQARGMWLEVDRIKPKDAYSEKNCVLACYFCNNDKSDVFNGDDYKLFFQNRYEFLKQILEKS